MREIRISCHIFPEDENTGTPDRKPYRIFYSEPNKKDLKSKFPAAVKRAIDITGSLAALILLSPVLAIISVLVKRTSEGPVFFRQKRVGQFGEEFTFLKFRSMYVNNDPAIHKEYVQSLIEKKVDAAGGA